MAPQVVTIPSSSSRHPVRPHPGVAPGLEPASSAQLLQRHNPLAMATATSRSAWLPHGLLPIIPPCPMPWPTRGRESHSLSGELAAVLVACSTVRHLRSTLLGGRWGFLLVFLLLHEIPLSWEDWTSELLLVKNSKSNIFLAVFLYSN